MHVADNFAYVIPVDELEHALDKPFCWNPTCPCHADIDDYLEVLQFVSDGLLTSDEATLFVAGRTV